MTPRPAVLAALTLSGLALGSLPFALGKAGVLLNYSDSVRGFLFLRSSDPSAPYIGFCAPGSANAVLRAAFSELPGGECPGGYPPLLKRSIEAAPDHPIALDAEGFTFQGKRLPNTAPKALSKLGIPLTHYPFGVYRFGIWPVSLDSPDSYDARYFGPISPALIRFHAIRIPGPQDAPLLTALSPIIPLESRHCFTNHKGE